MSADRWGVVPSAWRVVDRWTGLTLGDIGLEIGVIGDRYRAAIGREALGSFVTLNEAVRAVAKARGGGTDS